MVNNDSDSPLAIVATRIVQESLKTDASLPLLTQLAQSDPAFAVRLLASVNGAAHALRTRTTEVRQAVSLLGVRGVRNLGLGLALSDLVPLGDGAPLLIANSLRRAVAAKWLGARLGHDPDELFSVGLLLEVGTLSHARRDLRMAVEVAKRPAAHRHLFERSAGLRPHSILGVEIAKKYHLADTVLQAIEHHHDAAPPAPPFARIAWVAEHVAATFEGGPTARNQECAVRAMAQLRLGESDVAELMEMLPGAVTQAAAFVNRDVGRQPSIAELTEDASRSLGQLNAEYELVVRHLEQLLLEKELLATKLREANEQLLVRAATDGLTGLPNKMAFNGALERDIARAHRAGTCLSVVMMDVDFFKRVNDTHGHLVGDTVLQEVARHLKTVLRAGDMASRFGGEEFVVLLAGADLDGAARVAERIRAGLEQLTIQAGAAKLSVTASFGVASLNEIAGSEITARADEALYRAKREGRNRVVLAASEKRAARTA